MIRRRVGDAACILALCGLGVIMLAVYGLVLACGKDPVDDEESPEW